MHAAEHGSDGEAADSFAGSVAATSASLQLTGRRARPKKTVSFNDSISTVSFSTAEEPSWHHGDYFANMFSGSEEADCNGGASSHALDPEAAVGNGVSRSSSGSGGGQDRDSIVSAAGSGGSGGGGSHSGSSGSSLHTWFWRGWLPSEEHKWYQVRRRMLWLARITLHAAHSIAAGKIRLTVASLSFHQDIGTGSWWEVTFHMLTATATPAAYAPLPVSAVFINAGSLCLRNNISRRLQHCVVQDH